MSPLLEKGSPGKRLLLFDWGQVTTVSGQITKLLVQEHGVVAAALDHCRQHAGFYAAKHGHSQLPLAFKFLVEVQSCRALTLTSWVRCSQAVQKIHVFDVFRCRLLILEFECISCSPIALPTPLRRLREVIQPSSTATLARVLAEV